MSKREIAGGVAAASGLRYQYLRTLEELLTLAESDKSEVSAVRIEGSIGEEAVDYALEGLNGERLKVVQVKSAIGTSSRRLSAGSTIKILRQLMRSGEAERYELVTNATLSSGAGTLAAMLKSGGKSGAELLGRNDVTGPFTEDELDRLPRCRITADERPPDQTRDHLRDQLRAIRRRSRLGIGSDACAALVRILLDDVFGRATEPLEANRILPLTEFRDRVMLDGSVIADALGEIGWGIPIGPMPLWPEVRREAEEDRLDLLTSDSDYEGIHRCALIGPSGIGKSSIAARFAYSHADMYDRLIWIDAENEDTLRSSFRRIADALARPSGPEATTSDDLLRDFVHRKLASYSGTCLVVFDNAADHHLLAPWLPPRMRGDVIVTSINSASWHRYDRIVVGEMTDAEAVQLLRRRLSIADSPSTDLKLLALSQALGHWPLALEMAASWLIGCERGLDDLPAYIEQLSKVSLDDEASVPEGYPRTLVAAILLALRRLAEQSDPSRGIHDPSMIALEMLRTASLFAPTRISLHLLLACTAIDPREKLASGLEGPVFLEGQTAGIDLDQVVRALRTQSLARRDRTPKVRQTRKPVSTTRLPATAFDTISCNEIVQRIVRDHLDAETLARSVCRSAFHVQEWLAWTIDARDQEGVQLLHPHAARIAEQAMTIASQNDYVALLFGNLALSFSLYGDHERAVTLLTRELDYLARRDPSPPALGLKARAQLADERRLAGHDVTMVLDEVQAAIEVLETHESTERVAADAPRAAFNLYQLLLSLRRTGPSDPRVPALLASLKPFRRKTEGLGGHREVALISDLIGAGRALEAFDRCELLLQQSELDAMLRAETLALKAEACAHLQRWSVGLRAVEDIGDALPAFIGSEGTVRRLLDVALVCSTEAISESRGDAAGLLRSALAFAERQLRDTAAPLLDLRTRYHLLRSVLATADADTAAARQHLEFAERGTIDASSMQSTQMYDAWRSVIRQWLRSGRSPRHLFLTEVERGTGY